jgi:DNA-binding NarL/FixJ family response regulator
MKLRIIVADDNPKMLDQVVLLLRTEFDVVATALNGACARECIKRYSPDLAVLDVVMPGVNGIELTKELSRNGHSTRVVICSVENDLETIEAARNAGALGYVFKPRMARDLVAAVKAVAAGSPFTSPE